MEKNTILLDTSEKMVFDGNDIQIFQQWLLSSTHVWVFHQQNVDKVFEILEFATEIHKDDIRKDKTKYINHIVRVILDGDHLLENTSLLFMPQKIMVRAVHDIIEDHPEKWHELYNKVWLKIFRDALALATGGITLEKRAEMLDFFMSLNSSDSAVEILDDVNRILTPMNPFSKLEFSYYTHPEHLENKKRMHNAISIYHHNIIKKESRGVIAKDQDMYIALGNYIYFTRDNARDKVADMYDNMGDMAAREQERPWYTQKRRIKAYILGVKLREYKMKDEYKRLEEAFHHAGSSMLSDDEVEKMFRDIRRGVPLPWEG